MPRVKAAARRVAKGARAPVTVGYDDILPTWIVDYLLALPTSDVAPEPSHGTQRSAKRRKIEADPVSAAAIPIAKSELSFSRRCQDVALAPVARTIRDAGSQLKFHLRDGRLAIGSRSTSALGRLSRAETVPWLSGERRRDAHRTTRKDDFGSPSNRKISQSVIDAFFPLPETAKDGSARSPLDFYEAAYVPPKEDDTVSQQIQVPGLETTLFPYQKRSLKWLLAREGMQWSCRDSRLEPVPVETPRPSTDSFRVVRDANGRDVFTDSLVKGGILAEEMGLGKTLEILGLILVHRRPDLRADDGSVAPGFTPTRATLIVTPGALKQQWMSEISRHAPSLKVMHYRGCKNSQDDDVEEAVRQLADHDIVITTYAVLSAELHFALEPPQRARRYERAYPRITSPLVRMLWWRLCLDEAQMIENGYGQAASVARAIPRVNAWGISGTPIKNDVKDLLGLLLFLGYQPYCYAPQVWTTLVERHKTIFQQMFGCLALRHTKEMVQDEINLPAQKRYVISMPFTAVEEQHYQSLFKEMAEACNVDLDGAPLVDGWDARDYEDVMRTWLNRLRQAALHPEIGAYSRRLLGSGRARPMRTIEEVLAAMLEQSENGIRNDERAYLSSRLTRGQLYENSPRVEEALATWKDVRDETEALVTEARAKLKDAIRQRGGDAIAVETEEGDNDPLSSSSETDSRHDDGESKGRVGEGQRRLRLALELHHKAVFFCANAFFQMREKEEEGTETAERLKKLEDEGYERAKAIRRDMLRGGHRKADRFMKKIARSVKEQRLTRIPELVVGPERGIESGQVADRLEVLYGELNEQAKVLDSWREELVKQLLGPLVDEDDDEAERTGEELGDSAKSQDLLLVYYQALRAVIADRIDAISGQKNELVRHETETSKRLAQHGDGPAPESMLSMLEQRARIKPKQSKTSLRGAISEFRALQARSRGLEAIMAATQLATTQKQLLEQNKVALALESEAETFKAAMNARLEYYRQLQAVSDAVLPYEGPRTEEAEARMRQTEEEMRQRLAAGQAKHRYLLNLSSAGNNSSEPPTCVICQLPFSTGVLTVCGHEFCKECMRLWFKAHHNCPVCKRALRLANLHHVTVNPQRLQLRSEPAVASSSVPPPLRPLSDPGEEEDSAVETKRQTDDLAAIQAMSLGPGPSYPTKLATLLRHLLYLRETDPGAKSVVFSQYHDFLHQLRLALSNFHINHASVSASSDPSVEVFLLHARAHASGLNLVAASHVFLAEPLLSPALEMQAVARVHRIGQRHQTTVWLYLVAGSVEEAIYRARRRAAEQLEPSPVRMLSRDGSAGELVPAEALWDCLFGHRS
ncbi:hypothetical protein XA68_10830 [Ophiocordyceps unilateralis]|uniref:RING-type domain-containing protein n=1 Tax=Ophiocordyceps unilateralis TaxID=268505 RepID=A0A2A9PI80_OPHUN|nr:hypothetical protein XA68_10830 [Ophiocordyceps unilateralis]